MYMKKILIYRFFPTYTRIVHYGYYVNQNIIQPIKFMGCIHLSGNILVKNIDHKNAYIWSWIKVSVNTKYIFNWSRYKSLCFSSHYNPLFNVVTLFQASSTLSVQLFGRSCSFHNRGWCVIMYVACRLSPTPTEKQHKRIYRTVKSCIITYLHIRAWFYLHPA